MARRARLPVAIVVLAKHPIPGAVKTRLAGVLGPENACDLYRAFVLDLADRLRRTGLPVWWAFTPSSAPFARLVRTQRCFPQRSGDLGRRIAHALAVVRRRGAAAAIALGTDAPHVSLREIARAARALARGTEVVLGPAADGGYYLVGVRTPRRGLFEGIPWSTSRVLATTRARCRRLGLSCVELAPDFDVDGPRDLVRLRRLLRGRAGGLRHTRAALRAMRGPAANRRQSPRRIASA